MKTAILAGVVLAVTVCVGCATRVRMPELSAGHPAHKDTAAGKEWTPPPRLALHFPVPGTHPSDSAAEHDHMQQWGHGEKRIEGMMHPGPPPEPHGHDDEEQSLPAADGVRHVAPAFRCPRHPEEVSPYIGNCPVCGVPLEPIQDARPPLPPSTPGTAMPPESGYYCTMHPQVVKTVPGLCPECGMTLVDAGEGMK